MHRARIRWVLASRSHDQCALNGAGAKFMQALVRDNDVDQALRVLKKKMQRDGVFRNEAA